MWPLAFPPWLCTVQATKWLRLNEGQWMPFDKQLNQNHTPTGDCFSNKHWGAIMKARENVCWTGKIRYPRHANFKAELCKGLREEPRNKCQTIYGQGRGCVCVCVIVSSCVFWTTDESSLFGWGSCFLLTALTTELQRDPNSGSLRVTVLINSFRCFKMKCKISPKQFLLKNHFT